MLDTSSGALPLRCSNAFPAGDCKAANLHLPVLSQSNMKLTPPLQRLHTPSNKMMGLMSPEKNPSPGREVEVVVVVVVALLLVEFLELQRFLLEVFNAI